MSEHIGDSYIRCLIKKEGSWSEIKAEQSKTLDEKAQWLQKQSKTTFKNQIFNNKIVDLKRN